MLYQFCLTKTLNNKWKRGACPRCYGRPCRCRARNPSRLRAHSAQRARHQNRSPRLPMRGARLTRLDARAADAPHPRSRSSKVFHEVCGVAWMWKILVSFVFRVALVPVRCVGCHWQRTTMGTWSTIHMRNSRPDTTRRRSLPPTELEQLYHIHVQPNLRCV